MTAASPHTCEALAQHLLSHRLATGHSPDAMGDLLRVVGSVLALSRDFGAYLPPTERLRTLTNAVCAALGAKACHIHVPDGDEVFILRGSGATSAIVQRKEWTGPAADAFDNDRRVLLPDRICVPLPNEVGNPFAVLVLADADHAFTEEDAAAAAWAGPWVLVHARCVLGLGEAVSEAAAPILVEGDDPLDRVLANLLEMAVEIVDADRGALFFHDPATSELYTRAVIGLGEREIRLPAGLGLVGSVFVTGETLNCTDVYDDHRFNPAVDRRTGYVTRTALCVPIVDVQGTRIGVLQAINKREGVFDRSDERRLKVLSQQVSAAENYWRVFHRMAEVKTYNDSILASLSNGVLTVDPDGAVTYFNQAAVKILDLPPDRGLGHRFADIFAGSVNAWLPEVIDEVIATGAAKFVPMAEIETRESGWTSVNITVTPLMTEHGNSLGYLMVLEDVTREQTFRRTMSRYVHDAVVETLANSDGKGLEGNRQKVSVLFSDIRSFTTLTESLGAEETVQMLNGYFSFMEDVVTNRRGMVDKYIGDALMALFGAPASAGNDADNAVTAAIDMFQALRMFNQRRSDDPIAIGIGIATGQVITGDIGSSKRLDFTAIGNPVNLSSRLESLTKFYGTDIMICGDTYAELSKPFRSRKIDFIRVRGQSKPTSIYEVVDHRRSDELPAHIEELFGLYGKALETYLAGDWESALRHFQNCLGIDDGDRPSRVMLQRCRQLIANPPPNWENVWTYR